MSGGKAVLRAVLDQPVMGFAPWIVLSVVDGPDRVMLADALACGLALLICLAGVYVASSPKLLDITAIAFFGALTIVAALASPPLLHWLGLWSAELSNMAIAAIAALSIALRAPFTLQYARETTDPVHWKSPLFLKINYAITAVWSAAFVLTAIVGFIGDGPLHQPNNIWTNWIIQVALVVLAIKFTRWYPEHATAEAEAAPGTARNRARSARELLRPLAAYLVPVGVLVLLVGGTPWWIGAGLILLGMVTTRLLRRATPPEVAPSDAQSA